LDHLIEMLIQVYTPLQTVSKDLNIPLARGLAELDKEFSAAVEARAEDPDEVAGLVPVQGEIYAVMEEAKN